MAKRSGPEGTELFIELGTDAADLGLGDAGLQAESRHQVVDLPGRDSVDVGLHDHGEQGPVDPPPAFEDARKEAALAELRDLQVHVSGLGREQPVPGAVALGRPGAGALKALRSDLGSRLGVDEGLEHDLHAATDDVDVATRADRVKQFVQVAQGVPTSALRIVGRCLRGHLGLYGCEVLRGHQRLVDLLSAPDQFGCVVPPQLRLMAGGDVFDVEKDFVAPLAIPDLAPCVSRVHEDGLTAYSTMPGV